MSPPFLQYPRSLSLFLSLSLSFLHHKHFQRWHTRVDSHPESSATTIMSMLSSHNNTRITCWGRQALLGAVSPTWLPRIESVNTSQMCTCWGVKCGVEFRPQCAVFRLISAASAVSLLYFCVRGVEMFLWGAKTMHIYCHQNTVPFTPRSLFRAFI